MRIRALLLVVLGVLAQAALCAPAEERPALKGVSAVRISNYGAPSVLVRDRDDVRSILEELTDLRKKTWRRGDTRMRCYATVQLLVKEKPLTVFRVRPEYVVERTGEKEPSSFTLVVDQTDLPKLRKMLTEIPPGRCQ
jgi:ArsR family metal-binding transcriptional regulator